MEVCDLLFTLRKRVRTPQAQPTLVLRLLKVLGIREERHHRLVVRFNLKKPSAFQSQGTNRRFWMVARRYRFVERLGFAQRPRTGKNQRV